MRISVLAALAMFGPAVAVANPRPLPYSYPYETLPEDKLQIDHYLDLVPVRLPSEVPDGTLAWRLRAELQTEVSVGVTDRLELAVAFGLRQDATQRSPSLQFVGFRQRARYRFAELGDWPLDIALQAQVTEYHDGVGFDERLVVSKRLDSINIVANLWVEQRYSFQLEEWKHIYNPSGGVTYEISPAWSVGAEYWSRGRFDSVRAGEAATDDPGGKTYHYAGPAVFLRSGRLLLTAGAYIRLDRITTSADQADPFGKLWFRTLVGVEL